MPPPIQHHAPLAEHSSIADLIESSVEPWKRLAIYREQEINGQAQKIKQLEGELASERAQGDRLQTELDNARRVVARLLKDAGMG